MWRLGRKVTNSWKTALVYLKNRSGPTNPIDSFPAVTDPGERGSAVWVQCHFDLKQALLLYHKETARGLIGSTQTQCAQLPRTVLCIEPHHDPGNDSKLGTGPRSPRLKVRELTPNPSSSSVGATVCLPGVLGLALTLYGDDQSVTKAVPGWPLGVALGVREKWRRQVAVLSSVWTRIS